mgnify:CR=1 FL=1
MKHIGIAAPDTWVSVLNWVGIPPVVLYFVCMFYPLYSFMVGDGDWVYVQDVWYRWQSLNVGVLAFTSSVIALNISIYNTNKQRERNFVAARAFLPEAFSELTTYFKLCAPILKEAWQIASKKSTEIPLQAQVPDLLASYKEIFRQCINFAEPDVGERLAYILCRLQVHNSLIKELSASFGKDSTIKENAQNIITYLYSLAELQALVNKTFDYARGLEEFDSSNLVWEDYRNAYANLDISTTDFDDLVGFTQRAIKRYNSHKNI